MTDNYFVAIEVTGDQTTAFRPLSGSALGTVRQPSLGALVHVKGKASAACNDRHKLPVNNNIMIGFTAMVASAKMLPPSRRDGESFV